jgi:PAS domain S-box-containing protein
MWNREGSRLRFEITPHLWQTTWFRAAAAFLGASLLAGAVWIAGERRTRRAREKLEQERTLAHAQARLAHVLEHTSDVVAFFEPSGTPVYLNQAGRAILGIAPEKPDPKLAALFPPWAETIHRSHALPSALNSGTWSGELALARRGEDLPVSAHFVAHRDARGDVEFVSMIARDISAAKRHAEIQETLRTLATHLSAATSAVQLGRATAVACRSLFRHDGFFLATVRRADRELVRLYHAEDERGALEPAGPETQAIEARLLSELAEVLAGQPLLVADRPDVPCRIGRSPRRAGVYVPIAQAGRVVGVLAIQSSEPGRYRPADLAQLEMVASQSVAALARLEAEEQLKSHEDHLRRSQKLESIGTLAGGIAHDFNNILAGIIGWLGVARPSVLPGTAVKECFDNIERSSLRARDLVRQILAFSRTQEAKLRSADVAEVAEGVGKLLRASAPRRVQIEVTAATGLPPANVDPTELHHVLLNLGTNAVQAIGQGSGSVTLRVTRAEEERGKTASPPPIRIVVEDNGCGIPEEVLPRIFDPFFTTKAVGQGSGLGLSVAHGIVKSSGGSIAVQSKPGAGSTFTVLLPASAEARPAPAPAPAPPPPSTATHRIVLVDDEPAITLSLALLLRRDGNEVVTFHKPADALAAFQKDPQRFDLLLTDFSMPQMNGLELAAAVHAVAPSVPIIMMSGYAQSLQRDTLQAAGIAKVLDKPVEGHLLFRSVTQALRREPITD